jgi:hypothetical protein
MDNPNFRCIVVSYGRVSGRAKRYPYWEPSIYYSYITKDEKLVWKLHGTTHLKARRSYALAKKDAQEYAKNHNIPFIDSHIRQYNAIKTKVVLNY